MAFRERDDVLKSSRLMNDSLFYMVAIALGGVVVTLFTGMQMPQASDIGKEQLPSLVSQAATGVHSSALVINR